MASSRVFGAASLTLSLSRTRLNFPNGLSRRHPFGHAQIVAEEQSSTVLARTAVYENRSMSKFGPVRPPITAGLSQKTFRMRALMLGNEDVLKFELPDERASASLCSSNRPQAFRCEHPAVRALIATDLLAPARRAAHMPNDASPKEPAAPSSTQPAPAVSPK